MSDLPTIQAVMESHNASTGEPVEAAPVSKVVVEEAAAPVAAAKEPETRSEPVAKPEPKRDPASAKFGALARKEAEVRKAAAAHEQRAKEMEARETALKEREARLINAKKNPIAILKEHGFSYADATEAVLGNYKEPEADPIDDKFKPYAERFDKYESTGTELKRQLEEITAKLAAKEQQEAIGQVMKNINETLADKDRYELINAVGSEATDMVRDVMVEHWNQHNEMLDYHKAADIVESYYDETFVNRLSSTKKFQAKLPKPEPKPVPKPAAKAPAEPKERASLTNDMVSGGGVQTDIDKMSRDEFIAHASKKLMFK